MSLIKVDIPATTAEEKNAAKRDAVAIHNIMDKLETAASYA